MKLNSEYRCPACGWTSIGKTMLYYWIHPWPGDQDRKYFCTQCGTTLVEMEEKPMNDTTRIYPISKRVKVGPDPLVVEAIEGSIQKWESILASTGKDEGGKNCPLCQNISGCDECPIRKKTGRSQCGKTPYAKWCSHQQKEHGVLNDRQILCPECAKLAYEEVMFLKELLGEYLETEVAQLSPMTYYGGDHLECSNGEKYLVAYTDQKTYLINEKTGCYRRSESNNCLSEEDLDFCFRSWDGPFEIWVVVPSKSRP